MKIVELLSNIRLPITNEEHDLLGKFIGEDIVEKSKLSKYLNSSSFKHSTFRYGNNLFNFSLRLLQFSFGQFLNKHQVH